MEKIYLASRSPRRAELLRQMGVPFEILKADADEDLQGASLTPEERVCRLARRKAEEGIKLIREGWVLAADTLVFLDGEPLGKPGNEQRAREMLEKLSGREHLVLTGMCLMHTSGRCLLRRDGAHIVFDDMTDAEIADYAASGEPLDKAGAYGIQGKAGQFIREIRGDYYATVGLSLCGLRHLLSEAGLRD